jgi:hypothetical protein
VDNIEMDLREITLGVVDWSGLAQGREKWRALVNTVMNISGSIKCLETIEWLHNWWPLE